MAATTLFAAISAGMSLASAFSSWWQARERKKELEDRAEDIEEYKEAAEEAAREEFKLQQQLLRTQFQQRQDRMQQATRQRQATALREGSALALSAVSGGVRGNTIVRQLATSEAKSKKDQAMMEENLRRMANQYTIEEESMENKYENQIRQIQQIRTGEERAENINPVLSGLKAFAGSGGFEKSVRLARTEGFQDFIGSLGGGSGGSSGATTSTPYSAPKTTLSGSTNQSLQNRYRPSSSYNTISQSNRSNYLQMNTNAGLQQSQQQLSNFQPYTPNITQFQRRRDYDYNRMINRGGL